MQLAKDMTAYGRVREVRETTIVFVPAGTNYQLHLLSNPDVCAGPTDKPVYGTIRVRARKVLTVPSGGSFVAPIIGPPRIIQGRVRHLEDQLTVVQAGTFFVVALPASQGAIDLNAGPIEVGAMVNVSALPGASFGLCESDAGKG